MEKIKRSVLKTFLLVCLGLFITTIAGADPFGPPDPPGRPNVSKLDATSCTLDYLPPRYDGGSAIIGYYIEYRYIDNNRWIRFNRTPHGELTFSPYSITPGRQIQFRVIAVNLAGESQPSKPSDPVTPEAPHC